MKAGVYISDRARSWMSQQMNKSYLGFTGPSEKLSEGIVPREELIFNSTSCWYSAGPVVVVFTPGLDKGQYSHHSAIPLTRNDSCFAPV